MPSPTKQYVILTEYGCGHFWHKKQVRGFLVKSKTFPRVGEIEITDKETGRVRYGRIAGIVEIVGAKTVKDD